MKRQEARFGLLGEMEQSESLFCQLIWERIRHP